MKTKKTLNDFLIWLKCSGLLTVYFETINNTENRLGLYKSVIYSLVIRYLIYV